MGDRSCCRGVRSVSCRGLREVPRVVAHGDPPQRGHGAEMLVRSSQPIGDGDVVVSTSKTLDDATEIAPNSGPIELEAEVHLFEVGATHAQQIGPMAQFVGTDASAPCRLLPREEMPYEDAFRGPPDPWPTLTVAFRRTTAVTASAISPNDRYSVFATRS